MIAPIAAARPGRDVLEDGLLVDAGASEILLWGVAGGLGVMYVVVKACRHLALRWSWPLVGSPVVLVAWALDHRYGAALGAGMASAAGVLAYWEHEDIERGGAEATRVRESVGVLAGIRSLAAAREPVSRVRHGRLAIGLSRGRGVVTIPFGEREGKRGFICGAPGTGKTVDIVSIAAAYAGKGLAVICVDPKGDRSLEDGLRRAAHAGGRQFACWSPSGTFFYNPLARGGPTEIADKALAGEQWSEPHYLRQAQRYVGAVMTAMAETDETPSLSTLVRYFDRNKADTLARKSGADREEGATALGRYLHSLSPQTWKELGGVRDRLAILSESELGGRLEPGRGCMELDLDAVLRGGGVAYFRLDSDRYPLAAQMLGAAIVSDLVSLTGQLQGAPVHGLVVVDEFAAVAADDVSRLLSRSRSAGLSVLLAAQTLADLDRARPGDSTESLRRQVLANVDYLIAHRQSEPEAADTLAAMAGTRPTWAVTRKVGPALGDPWGSWGREGTRVRQREFVRHPDEFKRLRVGEAIVIELASRGEAQVVRMWPMEDLP